MNSDKEKIIVSAPDDHEAFRECSYIQLSRGQIITAMISKRSGKMPDKINGERAVYNIQDKYGMAGDFRELIRKLGFDEDVELEVITGEEVRPEEQGVEFEVELAERVKSEDTDEALAA